MNALTIKNLTKTYANNVRALNHIDLEISEGDYFALLGPNGAGKTTLIGILTSLVKKTSGKVVIFEQDIETNFTQAKALIGVVPQEMNFNIFETVWTIVVDQAGYYGIPRKTAIKRAEYYLKQLNLWGKRHSVSRFLSGGMKKRLMIARALIHEPRMLILDEPTAGVDVELRHTTWEFLKKINNDGTTIILTTHYLEEAESQCRNIAIIDQGEIIERSEMTRLLQTLEYENVIFYLDRPLEKVPVIENCKFYPKDPYTLEIEFPKKLGISGIIDILHQQNVRIIMMSNKSGRLEKIFLGLTQKNNYNETEK